MDRALTNLQSQLRGWQNRIRHRRGLEVDSETKALHDCGQEASGDEQPGQNGTTTVDTEKNQPVHRKRLFVANLKRRGKNRCGSNTSDHFDGASNRETKRKPFKGRRVKSEDDTTVDLLEEELPECKPSKKSLGSVESPTFWHSKRMGRRTAPEVSTEYNCLTEEQFENQHELAFDNQGLECPPSLGSGIQGSVIENRTPRIEIPPFTV